MESAPLPAVAADLAGAGPVDADVGIAASAGAAPIAAGPAALEPLRGPLRVRSTLAEPAPDEPLAVVATGHAEGGRTAVLGALLGETHPVLRVPAGSFLVLSHAQLLTGAAYVPGYREPHAYRSEPIGAGPALARPPRRVELAWPDPLLRRFAVVDTPDTGTLGPAGVRVVLDAVRRAGALLFVISAGQSLTTADLALLAEVPAGEVAAFFVVTPAADGSWSAPGAPEQPAPGRAVAAVPAGGATAGVRRAAAAVPPVDPGAVDPAPAVERHRAALLAAVPALAEAHWFALDPATGDTAYLRRALVDWAAAEGLRRAGGNPPVAPGATRTVRVVRDAHESGWEDRLERQVRNAAHRIRQHLALELANIHLRCVQEIVFGAGCAGLPEALDREVHALSLRAVAECDAAVARVLDETSTRVFGEPPDEGVRRRVAAAVREGLPDHPAGRDLDRVLLVTSTGGVATVTGPGAVGALPAYLGATGTAVLPPFGVGLSGGCYQLWRNPGNADPAKARSWLQRALREIELELGRELARRFEAVQLALRVVVADAVDHGILLA